MAGRSRGNTRLPTRGHDLGDYPIVGDERFQVQHIGIRQEHGSVHQRPPGCALGGEATKITAGPCSTNFMGKPIYLMLDTLFTLIARRRW